MMKHLALSVIVALLATGPALGQDEPDIVDACLKVAELETGLSDLVADDVQAFPELKSPRVQMTIGAVGPAITGIAALIAEETGRENPVGFNRFGAIRCEFTRAERPFELTSYSCSASGCPLLSLDSRRQQRLEEIQVLLAREGY